MAVRIQFRRGTAAEWAAANPTLAPGELGYEVDTAKFKLGDGSTAWASLDYAGVNQQDIEDAIANVIDLAPEDLNTLSELANAINNDPNVFDNLNSAIANAQAIAITYADVVEANALAYTDTAIANLVSSAPGTLDTLNELAAALGDDPNFATTITTALGEKLKFISDTNANFLSANAVTELNTVYLLLGQPGYFKIGDGVTAYGDLDFAAQGLINTLIDDHATQTNVHGISNALDLVYTSDLDFATTTLENSISSVSGNLNTVSASLDTLSNTVTDVSSDVAVLDGRVDALDATVLTLAPLTGAVLTTPELANASLTGSTTLSANATIAGVTSDELGYLSGVTGAIQTQLNVITGDIASLEVSVDTKADADNAVITSSASLPANTTIGSVTSDEISYLSGVQSGIQNQLGAKAPADSPTFSGTVILPTTTSIGNVSSSALATLENVVSDIQQQFNGKADNSVVYSSFAQLGGATFVGPVVVDQPGSFTLNTPLGTVSGDNLIHVANVSSDIQTQLNTKLDTFTASTLYAPISNATLTGTVSLPSDTTIGNVTPTILGYLSSISSGVQEQIDNTLSLSGGTMTGKITLDGDPTQALHAVTKQYVDSVEAGLITRPAVRAATTEPLPSAGTSVTYDNGTDGVGATLNLGQLASLTIDGISSWTQWDGILVKDQTNKFENGRYVVFQIGNDVDTDWILRRCSLCDTADEIPGSYIFVTDGTTNEQTGWVQHVDDPATFTVGTDDIDVYQFAGAGAVTAGSNISVSGNQVSVVSDPTFSSTITAGNGLRVIMGGVQFGDNTIQYSAGVPSLSSFTEKTSNYTLDDVYLRDGVVEMNSSSATTFTIPTDNDLDWPIGGSMDIFQIGTGQVTIANAVGVTLNFTPGNKLRTQWSSCTIMKRGANSWVMYGDLTA